jgi:Na+/H+-dicarboxylate symporter
VFGFAYLVMRHTRLPFRTFLRDYFADVYPYAWATASSSATIPINLERAASGLRVRRQVRDFVIPLGATVNLDGTMIGGIVTAVAAAQMVGYTPTLVDLFLILVPLSIITIGVPGIPGGLAAVAAPVMTSLLPLPAGTEAAFTAIFIGFNIGLSDQFRTGVNSVDNGILSRLFEHWYPKRFAVDDGDAAGGPEARVAGASP